MKNIGWRYANLTKPADDTFIEFAFCIHCPRGKQGNFNETLILRLSRRHRKLLWLVLNVAHLTIALRDLEGFTLGLVDCLNQRSNLRRRTTFPDLNFRDWHDCL
jgi:hypothetical protein